MKTKNLSAKHALLLILDRGKLLKASDNIGKVISSFLFSHSSTSFKFNEMIDIMVLSYCVSSSHFQFMKDGKPQQDLG
jgi:hypothetical protein